MQTTLAPNFAPVDSNNPAISFCSGYLAPLDESIFTAFPLKAQEAGCQVMAIQGDWRHENDEATAGRLAVVRLIAREGWASIDQGTPIIFTELHRWSEEEIAESYPGEIGCYTTRIGAFMLCDEKRSAFYVATWDHDSGEFGRDTTEVFEVYTVERFIEVSGNH